MHIYRSGILSLHADDTARTVTTYDEAGTATDTTTNDIYGWLKCKFKLVMMIATGYR